MDWRIAIGSKFKINSIGDDRATANDSYHLMAMILPSSWWNDWMLVNTWTDLNVWWRGVVLKIWTWCCIWSSVFCTDSIAVSIPANLWSTGGLPLLPEFLTWSSESLPLCITSNWIQVKFDSWPSWLNAPTYRIATIQSVIKIICVLFASIEHSIITRLLFNHLNVVIEKKYDNTLI